MPALSFLETATASRSDRPDNILRELMERDFVSRLLDEVESDSNLVDHIAKHSYWHSTGIFKLVLWKPPGNTPEVRIHIWSKRSREFSATHVDSIHNHRWNFASRVLAGSFTKELFTTENTDHNDHQHFQFESQGRGLPNKVTHIGDVAIRTTFKTAIERDGEYYLDSRVLHRITPVSNDLSATLFVSSPNLFSFSDVLFSPDSRRQDSQPPPAPRLAPDLIHDLLAELRPKILRN